ncbi:unnamed protein product [Rotaria socialis]|uniref:Cytochrome P450 n=1 Tax=Rotaria socialis TaxID=392032 RepID=A0A818WHR4_9BILA|nr:unnamed protein product [Rotaria socialis]CAF4898033.1 unnamed protein product [Rotaria socialis]
MLPILAIITVIVAYLSFKLFLENVLYGVSNEPKLIRSYSLFGFRDAFLSDATGFCMNMRRQHGKVFSFYSGNKRWVFMHDKNAYVTQLLRSPNIRKSLIERFLTVDAGDMRPGFWNDTNIQKDIIDQYHTLLFGSKLRQLSIKAHDHLLNRLKILDVQKQNTVHFFDFVGELMFDITTTILFGATFTRNTTDNLYESFCLFNSSILCCVSSWPFKSWRLCHFIRDRDAFIDRFRSLKCTDDQSALIQARIEAFEEAKKRHVLNERDIAVLHAVLLMAASLNTVPMCGWIILDLLLHPEAHAAVCKELKSIDMSMLGESETLAQLIILESCIKETFRRSMSTMIECMVTTNMSIKASDGTEFGLRKNDYVLYPTMLDHLDSEKIEHPFQYRYDRFLIDKNLPLMLFGAGKYMCPGRYWGSKLNSIQFKLIENS